MHESATYLSAVARRGGGVESVAGGGGARVQPGRGLPLGLSGAAAAAPGRRAERPQPPRQGRWAPAGRLARRSWAASAAASGAGESNTFSLNFPAPVPANTHSRTHTRAQGEPLRGEPTGTGGSLAASFSLPRSYWRGGDCFIYLFPPPRSILLPAPPSCPSLLLLPLVCEAGHRGRSSCSVAGLRARAEAAAARVGARRAGARGRQPGGRGAREGLGRESSRGLRAAIAGTRVSGGEERMLLALELCALAAEREKPRASCAATSPPWPRNGARRGGRLCAPGSGCLLPLRREGSAPSCPPPPRLLPFELSLMPA